MTTSPLNLADERRWGELLLAAHDMTLTIKLIERIPAGRSGMDLFLDTIGVIAAYGRPFKKSSDRRPGVGVDFLFGRGYWVKDVLHGEDVPATPVETVDKRRAAR